MPAGIGGFFVTLLPEQAIRALFNGMTGEHSPRLHNGSRLCKLRNQASINIQTDPKLIFYNSAISPITIFL